jgi:hypothetical protein
MAKEPMLSKVIKYNLFDRKRKYNGQERPFDAVSWLVNAINSKQTQERVALKDMTGFYGHWPRIKLGLNPQEGGIVDGKPVVIEPALRTVLLKAEQNGDVTHQAEFLDNEAGRTAWALYKNGTGGFSSAVDTVKRLFWGFDFVLEPNYSSNRGHDVPMFDSVFGFDSAHVEHSSDSLAYGSSVSDVAFLLEDFKKERHVLLDTIDAQAKELDALRMTECDTLGQIVQLEAELKKARKAMLGFDAAKLNQKPAKTAILKSSVQQEKEVKRKVELLNKPEIKNTVFSVSQSQQQDAKTVANSRAYNQIFGFRK